MITALISGLILAGLSAWWAMCCQARRPVRAAVAEGIWALAVVAGVGAALRDPWSAGLFCLGTVIGTYLVVRYARP